MSDATAEPSFDVREQLARIDRALAAVDLDREQTRQMTREAEPRIAALLARAQRDREESEPRIAALLARAERDRAESEARIKGMRTNWIAILAASGTLFSGIAAILAVLVAGHILR